MANLMTGLFDSQSAAENAVTPRPMSLYIARRKFENLTRTKRLSSPSLRVIGP